jgi:hypothetical protein
MTMTGTNAPHVVRYLALTRRWRVAGLFVGLTAYLVDGLRPEISISILFAAGWFLARAAAGAGRRPVSRASTAVTPATSGRSQMGLVAATVLCLLVVVVGARLAPPDWPLRQAGGG